ncbi:MAG TPA: hypothetical protein VL485_08810 [Ktedonobacteraceae bacterium]|jgi:hypothetical protein|nr:hypothetical protein [Ktedonobacteraceae bacterium]
MFKPLRFNDLLKAVPGLDHLKLTPHAAHQTTHTRSHEHVEADEVRSTSQGVKRTHVKEDIDEDVRVKSGKEFKTTEVHKRITEDIRVKKVERNGDDDRSGTTISRVHATTFEVAEVEMTPPHPPREETPIYARTHRHLVYNLDTPCAICGVRNSTLDTPRENPFHAKAIETHHYPIERSLLNACDPRKVHVIFPQVKDYDSLEAFIDSEENMMVLCDIHHRHPHYGIHHILAQDFFIQPFLLGGYQVVAEAEDAQKVMQSNERVIQRHTRK